MERGPYLSGLPEMEDGTMTHVLQMAMRLASTL